MGWKLFGQGMVPQQFFSDRRETKVLYPVILISVLIVVGVSLLGGDIQFAPFLSALLSFGTLIAIAGARRFRLLAEIGLYLQGRDVTDL